MRATQEGVEAALDILGIEGVIDSKGWMMVCCPLHGDSNPSMAINVRGGGGWKCFSGCGTGTIMTLASKLTGGLNLEVLAALENPDPLRVEKTDDDIQKVLDSLKTRRPPRESDLVSYLGYCDYLRERGISQQSAKEFGLAYDPERRRLVIPIRDHRGKLKGAESRTVIESGHANRYTAMWRCDKSRWVWGAWRYRPTSPLLILEGALGAARASSLGAKTAVATLGASASAKQLGRLGQSSFCAIAYDPDAAGVRGSVSVADDLIVTNHVIVKMPVDIDDITHDQLYAAVASAAPKWVGRLMQP